MKISKIEYENFRNFKERGAIECATDGRVTIIYGKNGEGKTTLHQLLQWIFYGKVHFNLTTTNKLYNLSYEYEQPFDSEFETWGRIDFEHNGEKYSLTRKNIYKKRITNTVLIHESFELYKMNVDYDWKRINKPEETIEKLLPSGLADYFFFDGEGMIADLRVKGMESASKLKKALFSMFDLDILELASSHIGATELKTTVLGKLYLNKGTILSDSEIQSKKMNIENVQNRIDSYKNQNEQDLEKKNKLNEQIKEISEMIGSNKSKKDYEEARRQLQRNRDIFLNNSKLSKSEFGKSIVEMFSQLFVSKAVLDAKDILHLKVENSKLPVGISKTLINYLLKDSTEYCICGHELHENEKKNIRDLLYLMPPKSYAYLYNEFTRTAKAWANGYDKERIEAFIRTVLENEDSARDCDRQIKELDTQEKQSIDIQNLIEDRERAEELIKELDQNISKVNIELSKYNLYLKSEMKSFDKLTKETSEGKNILKQISIMEQVKEYFDKQLISASKKYSKELEKNIQTLLDTIFGVGVRNVKVSEDFAVTVTESHGDESKSEGQFAVVSFAYIGGILKMLQSEEGLSSKEYPLVLDGPFSKMDENYRQKVADSIPEIVPQIIIFSKDDLQEVFSKDKIGKVWTITSNLEKNVAEVKEGFLW